MSAIHRDYEIYEFEAYPTPGDAGTMLAPAVSFEFFPPSDADMAAQLWRTVERLAPLQPRFVSITYGADGSTRARTHDCVRRLLRETTLTVAPHLTCIGTPRQEILRVASDYAQLGIRHLVALRGDAPAGQPHGGQRYVPSPEAFAYAADLVGALCGAGPFDISVAAYPEGHPESQSLEADMENLRRKIDAGATRAITQFFFDTDVFLRFRDRCEARRIGASIVPGILPITRFPQMLRFAKRCGTAVPDWLTARFDGLDDDVQTRQMIAASVAIEQVQRLLKDGVSEFHFYTLNRAELTYAICHTLGVRPRQAELAPA